jgi:hypothetical protein
MRTTVTIDNDVERMLKDTMHRTRRSFKETLNDAVRAGLRPATLQKDNEPFVLKARELGLRPGYDPAGFNKLADELEVEAFMATYRGADST